MAIRFPFCGFPLRTQPSPCSFFYPDLCQALLLGTDAQCFAFFLENLTAPRHQFRSSKYFSFLPLLDEDSFLICLPLMVSLLMRSPAAVSSSPFAFPKVFMVQKVTLLIHFLRSIPPLPFTPVLRLLALGDLFFPIEIPKAFSILRLPTPVLVLSHGVNPSLISCPFPRLNQRPIPLSLAYQRNPHNNPADLLPSWDPIRSPTSYPFPRLTRFRADRPSRQYQMFLPSWLVDTPVFGNTIFSSLPSSLALIFDPAQGPPVFRNSSQFLLDVKVL